MKLITSLYLMKRNQEVHFVGKPPNVSAPNVMLSCMTSAFHGFMGYENKLLWLIYRIYIRVLKFIIFLAICSNHFSMKTRFFDTERGFSIVNTVRRPYSVKLWNPDSFFYHEWKSLFHFLPWYILSCSADLSW